MTRKDFLQTVAGSALAAYVPVSYAADTRPPQAKMKLGVTLYSYGIDYLMGTMNLEDCIADVASMGGEGVEILGETHVEGYPNPSAKWVEQWFALMNKYGTKPSCLDQFVDSMRYGPDKYLTADQSMGELERDFKLAKRLGYKILRPTFGKSDIPTVQLLEKAIPMAEKYDIKIAVELHSPFKLKSREGDEYLSLLAKTRTKHFGFTLDMSIFTKTPPRAQGSEIAGLKERGARDKVLEYVIQAYQNDMGSEKTMTELKKMGANEAEMSYASMGGVYHFSYSDPKDLTPYLPYTYHCHGKFYEMMDDLHEYSIPYEQVIPVMIAGGYSGYISSEFEGPQTLFLATDQIRRQHAMLRGLFTPA
jgi:hypothetical protein